MIIQEFIILSNRRFWDEALENILRFERHLHGAIQLKSKDLSDYLVYNTLAMECFQAVNVFIEIGEYIVAKEKLGFPSTYREIFEILAKEDRIGLNELKHFKRLVFLRNLIAHEYERISENELLEMASLLEELKDFVNRVKKAYKE